MSPLRNLLAGTVLAIGSQWVAWTAMDAAGLFQYGDAAWPYPPNPMIGGLFALVILASGLALLSRRPSISRAAAIALGISAGIHFWLLRHPAEPYKDYGEDNLVRLVLNTAWCALAVLVIVVIESAVRPEGDGKQGPKTPSGTDAAE